MRRVPCRWMLEDWEPRRVPRFVVGLLLGVGCGATDTAAFSVSGDGGDVAIARGPDAGSSISAGATGGAATTEGCNSDADCKGARICRSGRCVDSLAPATGGASTTGGAAGAGGTVATGGATATGGAAGAGGAVGGSTAAGGADSGGGGNADASTGGSGASAADGGADVTLDSAPSGGDGAMASPGAGEIACNGGVCDIGAGTLCCYAPPSSPFGSALHECVSATEAGACDIQFRCDGHEDCLGGWQCCGVRNQFTGYTSFECKLACDAADTIVGCSGPQNCPAGEVCCGDLTGTLGSQRYTLLECRSSCSGGAQQLCDLNASPDPCPGTFSGCQQSQILPPGYGRCG